MKLHDIKLPDGSRRKRKRVGRGSGSGHGKTSGHGAKGQNARSGGGITLGFEGGQMPLKRRIPKRGFTNIFKKKYALVNIGDLERFEPDTIVDQALLLEKGLIKKLYDGIKILGKGELTKSVIVKAHRVSQQAQDKINKAGGRIEIVEKC